MLIAKEKRKENIAEYILYMWQIEDTVRACNFNIDMIDKCIISQFSEPEKIKREIRDWYVDIILMMHEEGLKKAGHLSFVNSIVNDLYDLHHKLINDIKDPKYLKQYYYAVANIRDFEKKLTTKSSNEIETCLSALYALLLLRLKKKKLSNETLEAMQTFSNMLALLSHRYKNIESGFDGY
jgi:flagellin-specific chaperone FliS